MDVVPNDGMSLFRPPVSPMLANVKLVNPNLITANPNPKPCPNSKLSQTNEMSELCSVPIQNTIYITECVMPFMVEPIQPSITWL